MPSLLADARSLCPELVDTVKILDKLAYRRHYSEVFTDFVDWLVWQHHFPPSEENPIAEKYTADEQQLFQEMLNSIHKEVKKQSGLHQLPQNRSGNDWYDPLGRLYECITSKHKSSAMGQYFTPKPVVDMMTQITLDTQFNEEKQVLHILDPACGSGRMGLAAANRSMVRGQAVWVTMNDLDSICTKMTAANMCLNGIIGESLCSDGLDITSKSYRFGYRIEPLMAQIPPEMRGLYSMAVLAKTGQNPNKQYVVKPISYERSYLKQANDRLLADLKERQQIADEQLREQAVQELKDKVQERMKGTLFERDTNLLDDITNDNAPPISQAERIKKQRDKKKDTPSQGKQGSLF